MHKGGGCLHERDENGDRMGSKGRLIHKFRMDVVGGSSSASMEHFII